MEDFLRLLRFPEKQEYTANELIALLGLFALTNIITLATGDGERGAKTSLVQNLVDQVSKQPGQLNSLAGLLDKNQAAMQLFSLLNNKEEQIPENKRESKKAAAGE